MFTARTKSSCLETDHHIYEIYDTGDMLEDNNDDYWLINLSGKPQEDNKPNTARPPAARTGANISTKTKTKQQTVRLGAAAIEVQKKRPREKKKRH